MQQDYTYAVARIRFRETRLLSDADLNSLLSARDIDAALRLLRDKGWGDGSGTKDPEALLSLEEQRLWDFIGEIVEDNSALDFLRVPNDFHNLKVTVKCIVRDEKPDGLFLNNSVTDPVELYDAVKKREYDHLPEYLCEPAREAMSTLLQTGDGQLCDMIIDKACMEYVYRLGKESGNELIELYCELFTAASDIKIAVRSAKTNKKHDFILRALAQCDTLDIKKLASAAAVSVDEVLSYLGSTGYSGAVDAIRTSMSAFEKWCDDHLTDEMKSQKWEPFGVGPIVAYINARENEMKAVRLILCAKVNGLSEETVKERLRSMYV